MTDTIDVWRIWPLRRSGDVAALKAILSADEVARVERMGNAARQHAAITSRAILRLLLAHHTRIPANQLRFISGKNGKPHLDTSQNSAGFTFNFSDSADMALVAVTRNREVGVDVEKVRQVERAREIASRYFSPESADELARATETERSRVFLQNWVRYEALLKARAGTIWKPGTDQYPLTIPEPALYVQQSAIFTVRDIDSGGDYVGALAAEGDGWSIQVKDYSD